MTDGRAANASRAPGSVRAKAISAPSAASDITSDEPPEDTNGKGTPVTGSSSRTTAMLITAWPMIQAPMRSSGDLRKGFAVTAHDATDGNHNHREGDEHEQGADNAELLADDRVDEVVVGSGKVSPLLAAHAWAKAPQPARRERPRAVGRLQTVALGVTRSRGRARRQCATIAIFPPRSTRAPRPREEARRARRTSAEAPQPNTRPRR